jgi:hypothetical protein
MSNAALLTLHGLHTILLLHPGGSMKFRIAVAARLLPLTAAACASTSCTRQALGIVAN